MAELIFSNKAVEDLSNIWNYTLETWSESQADKYHTMLIESCRQIAKASKPMGKEYEEIMFGLYGYSVGKHIIFYRQHSRRTEIIRILHGQMDLSSRLED